MSFILQKKNITYICLYPYITNTGYTGKTIISHFHLAKVSSFVCCENLLDGKSMIGCSWVNYPINVWIWKGIYLLFVWEHAPLFFIVAEVCPSPFLSGSSVWGLLGSLQFLFMWPSLPQWKYLNAPFDWDLLMDLPCLLGHLLLLLPRFSETRASFKMLSLTTTKDNFIDELATKVFKIFELSGKVFYHLACFLFFVQWLSISWNLFKCSKHFDHPSRIWSLAFSEHKSYQ